MIVIMGLPGAGKTSVLEKVNSKKYKIINYGDLMFEVAQNKYNVKNRDQMRKLSTEIMIELQRFAAIELAKYPSDSILDTHCAINTPRGYFPGLPFKHLKEFRVAFLVYITAPVDEILERRKKDKSRKRDRDSREKLLEHDEISKAYLAAYSAYTGAPAKIIYNRDGKLNEAVSELKKVL